MRVNSSISILSLFVYMNKNLYTSHSDRYAFPRRRRKRFNVSRFSLFFFVILAFVCVGILYIILFSDFLRVKSIRVEGSRLVESPILISALVSQLHSHGGFSGMLGQDNILFWMFRDDIPSIQWMPEVRDIHISPSFSKRTVNISVTERAVKSVVCGGLSLECYAIDGDGFVFSRVPWIEGTLIPRFEEGGTHIVIGKRYFKKTEWFDNVFLTLSILEKNKLIPSSLNMSDDGTEEWEVTLSSGTAFYFSLNFVPENFEEIMRDIITRGGLDGVSYFDFRVQGRVYYK